MTRNAYETGQLGEITAGVRAVFAEILELDEIEVAADSDFYDDLDGDSLQKLELVMETERRFGVRFDQDTVADLTTPRHFAEEIALRAA